MVGFVYKVLSDGVMLLFCNFVVRSTFSMTLVGFTSNKKVSEKSMILISQLGEGQTSPQASIQNYESKYTRIGK